MSRLLRNAALLVLLAFLLPVLFLAQGPVFTTGQWVPDRTLHDARVGACTVTLPDGRMLATGGQGSAGALTSSEYLSVAGDLTTVAPMNVASSEHVCAVLPDGRVLVAGGRVSGNAATNAAEIYDPAADTWTNIASMREARIGAAVTVLADGRVLIAGGEASGTPSATLEVYDPGSQSFALVSGAMSSPRKNLAAARLSDGRVLLAGGSSGVGALATTEVFDPATGALGPAGNMTSPRTGLSATALDNGKVLLAGGSNGTQDLATSELFDPQTGSVAGGPSMGSPRRGHQAFLIPHNNNVLVVGGTAAGQPLASTEQFAWWSNAFTSLGSVSAARGLMTGGAGPTGLVTVAGGSLADGTASTQQDTILLPTVKTDKADYQPGDTAMISGSGWKPNETVSLAITETPDLDNDSPIMQTATADGAGNFSSTLSIDVPDLGVKFVLVATGQASGLSAEAGFTDAPEWTIGINPTSASVSSASTFTLTVNNTSTANGNPMGCVTLTAPPSFTLGTVGFSGTTPGGRTWGVTQIGQVITATASTNADRINGSEKLVFTAVVTPGTTTGSPFTWVVDARANTNCTGASFGVPTGGQPTVTVGKGTPTITWANPSDITYGTALSGTQLNATASVAGSFVYTPASGTVLNAGNGQTLHVDFTPTDPANYNNASKNVTINVLKTPQTITFAALAGKTFGDPDFAVSATASSGLTVTFAASGDCTSTGVTVHITGAGSCIITASQTGNGDYLAATDVPQTFDIAKATQTITFAGLPSKTFGDPDFAVSATASSGLTVTFAASGTCTVTGVTAHITGAGNCTITASQTGNSNYFAATDVPQTFAIAKAMPTITWANPANITYGTALGGPQLNATASVVGSFLYTPASGTVLNAGNGQTLHVDFTPTDAANYNNASKDVLINVNKANQTITWADPTDITYGAALSSTQLNATISVPGPDLTTGALTYTPVTGTILNAGNGQALQVDAAATANYNAATKTVNINVLKANQTITWNDPADITYGTALSGTQLNATVSVPGPDPTSGALTYTPAGGTFLNAGNSQALRVDATATINYNAATKTVHINVNKANQTVTWNDPADITYGTALSATQLNALVSVPGPDPAGALTYTPASGTILNAGAAQALQADVAGTSNYNPATKTVHINVLKATPAFSLLLGPTIVFGMTPTTLGGKLSAGSLYPTGNISITVNGVTQNAAISASDGTFSSSFATGFPVAAYTIIYNYVGDANFKPAGPDTSKSLTVNKRMTGTLVTFGSNPVAEGAPGTNVIVTVTDTDVAPLTTPSGNVTVGATSPLVILGSVSCTLAPTGPSTASCSVAVHVNDDGAFMIGANYLGDAVHIPSGSATTLNVNNVAPTITSLMGPLPTALTHSGTVTANFTDPGVLDTHICSFDWGDATTTLNVSGSTGSGSCSAQHTYASVGVYTVSVTVADNYPASVTQSLQYFVVYDPSAGFVTGGGWIISPLGAYSANPSLTDKANFGFVSKYEKGNNVPTGQTEFQFQVANFNFHSTSYDWLVIAGAKAQYKGSGTINGSGTYSFMLTAVDGSLKGGGASDTFRIKIWDPANTSNTTPIYDNMLGAADGSDPTTALGGGSIVIHK